LLPQENLLKYYVTERKDCYHALTMNCEQVVLKFETLSKNFSALTEEKKL